MLLLFDFLNSWYFQWENFSWWSNLITCYEELDQQYYWLPWWPHELPSAAGTSSLMYDKTNFRCVYVSVKSASAD